MNIKLKKFLAASFLAIFLTGCGTPYATTLTVPVLTPATATSPAVTNYVTVPVTNYAANSYVTAGAQYLNEAAPLIPAPWGTAATAVATLAAIIAGFIAQKQSAKANTSAGAAASLAAAIVSHPDSAVLTTSATTAAASNNSVGATAAALSKAKSPT